MLRAFNWLERGIAVTTVILLLLMVGLIGSQVGARYILNRPLPWTEELGRHLMVWMVFLGSAIAYRRNYHLGIDFVRDKLPPAGQHIFKVVSLLILGLFFFLMVQHGWQLSQRTMVQRSSALGYPIGYIYASLPISGALLFIFNFEHAVRLALGLYTKRLDETEKKVDGKL